MTLSVEGFKNNEVSVKVVDGFLAICAEHEEKPDDHGHVYRCIRRRYKLPHNADIEKMNASLNDNGTLVICTPKKQEEGVSTSACVFENGISLMTVLFKLGKRA